ncbi:hypothetical protein SDC9_94820 [bioreactor metagenome]|uniref:Uncharacterized protein n=1 Tax=bioreactor metagenome TaxID=1076179 RepID=A0A645A5W5_9ZZZZ
MYPNCNKPINIKKPIGVAKLNFFSFNLNKLKVITPLNIDNMIIIIAIKLK